MTDQQQPENNTTQRRAAIEGQIAEWKIVELNAEIAQRVAKRLKDDALLKANVDQMIRAETATDELTIMLKELDHESANGRHP